MTTWCVVVSPLLYFTGLIVLLDTMSRYILIAEIVPLCELDIYCLSIWQGQVY